MCLFVMSAKRSLAVVVPFHNEIRHLPPLFESLRAQSAQDVPVVFVDNASDDGSGLVVRQCPEVQRGHWLYIAETRTGKFNAVRTATAFCAERLGARAIAFLDADSCYGSAEWLVRGRDLADAAAARLGYVYAPLRRRGWGSDDAVTDRFESMLAAVEQHQAARELSCHVERLFHAEYARVIAPPPSAAQMIHPR